MTQIKIIHNSIIAIFFGHQGHQQRCFFGQLLLSSGPSNIDVYLPTETTITSCATFCIVSDFMSVVFIAGDPPPNTPNMPVQY